MQKVICPFCGYKMPVWFAEESDAHGIWVKCKNRDCKREFEIKIKQGKQS